MINRNYSAISTSLKNKPLRVNFGIVAEHALSVFMLNTFCILFREENSFVLLNPASRKYVLHIVIDLYGLKPRMQK